MEGKTPVTSEVDGSLAKRKQSLRRFVAAALLAAAIALSLFSNGRVVAQSSGGGQCAIPPGNLVSWWPGNGNAIDIQGGNNGTLKNGVTFNPGEVGQAFHFDRTHTQFVQTT